MIVNIASPLRSYTGGQNRVEACGASLDELVCNLDAKFPGIKFRIIDEQNRVRQHIKLFVNTQEVKTLDSNLSGADVVHIICALSGG